MTPEEVLQDMIQQSNAKQIGVNQFGNPQYQGHCPTHDDSNPSLSLSMGEESPMVKCQKGCETKAVVYAFGYAMSQLFVNHYKGNRRNGHDNGQITAAYDYFNERGEPAYQVCKKVKPNGSKTFVFRRKKKGDDNWIWNAQGIPRIIYRLPDVLAAAEGSQVFIVEGEKDADRLVALGLNATCNPGGASSSPTQTKWKDSYSQSLVGKHLVILPDNDDPGRMHANHVAKSTSKHAASVKVVDLPGLPEKGDVSDWLDAGGSVEKLLSLVDACDAFNVEAAEDGHLVICNSIETGDGETALPMSEIIERVQAVGGGWPRVAGTGDRDPMFAPTDKGVWWISSADAFFGYLGTVGQYPPSFSRGSGTHSKGEVLAVWRNHTHRYEAVEEFPHEPLMENYYYACNIPESGDGKALEKLLDYFTPETPMDRDLIKVALATPFWGGPGGSSPMFMVTSETGRGKGKSTLARMIGQFCGGFIDISPTEDIDKMKVRLLSSAALSKRVAIIDNIKSHRFSWSELEALITHSTISGRKLYAGEGQRPNKITYVGTMNEPALSTDIAQRCVLIKLGNPRHSGDWQGDVEGFAEENRDAIVADIMGFLRSPQTDCDFSRFGMWDRDVLQRLTNPSEVQSLIVERRKEADSESDESTQFDDHVRTKLEEQGYDVDYDKVFIPSSLAGRWFDEATNSRHSTSAASRTIQQKINEGQLPNMEHKRTAKARGFYWIGENAGESDEPKMDIEARIGNTPSFQ